MASASSPSEFLRSSSPHVTISRKNADMRPCSIRFRQPRASSATADRATTECLCPPRPAPLSSSLYELLGISMGASGTEIKAAYRKLARICHPDVAAIDRKGSSAEDFMKIHAAYSTLSDPEKRADYDRDLFRRHRPRNAYSSVSASPAKAASGFAYYARRNWETDQCW